MKANELRIGNLVYYVDGDGYFYQLNITVIEDGITNDFEPIPLTEEWLFRFGFYETSRYGKYLEFNINQEQVLRFPICKHSEKDFWYVLRGSVKIQYVHQLQNLYFALTGEELEIK